MMEDFLKQILGSQQPTVEERSAPQDAGGVPPWLAQMLQQQMPQAPQEQAPQADDSLEFSDQSKMPDRMPQGAALGGVPLPRAPPPGADVAEQANPNPTMGNFAGNEDEPDYTPPGGRLTVNRPDTEQRKYTPISRGDGGTDVSAQSRGPAKNDDMEEFSRLAIGNATKKIRGDDQGGFLSNLLGITPQAANRAQASFAAGLATIPEHPGSGFATGARAFGASLSGGQKYDATQWDQAMGALDRAQKARADGNTDEARREGLNLQRLLIGLKGQELAQGKLPSGFKHAPGGALQATKGGPYDPEYLKQVAEAKAKEKELSSSDRKAILEAEDEIPVLDTTLETLKQAADLNSKTFTGYTAGVRGDIGSKSPEFLKPALSKIGFDQESSEATTEWQKIMSSEAIKSMSATLKGATTDKEMGTFVSLLADPSTPPNVRGRVIERMRVLAERQKKIKEARANEIRGGTYFKPPAEAQPATKPGKPAAKATAASTSPPKYQEGQRARNPATGETVQWNGKAWVPAQ